MEIVEKDLPQLIVALDSLNDNANYVHILDAKDDIAYYCPCCKGVVKPRAYKKDKDYQVQAHYYHDTGGCNDETYVHYICKTWLFEKGCKFIVNDILYEVENVEVEKTLYTSFGDYRPDIIITTTLGKVFFFEIKTTNKKTELYAPKWDELGNDVVEVDTRYFINQKYKNDIPIFHLIYSDGECFIKSYTRSDYEDIIAKRKLEWKRQDKLNYKIQWERLDWFWIKIQWYVSNVKTVDDVLESFDKLDYSDKLWCYYTIKRKSCIDLKELFKNNINQYFLNILNSLKNDRISILLKQVSPKIYEVQCRTEFSYLDYILFEEEIIKVKVRKGDILSIDYEEDIRKGLSRLQGRIKQCENIFNRIRHISALPYVKRIAPYSHWASEKYEFHSLYFNIEFEENIHSRYIKEIIGKTSIVANQLSESSVKERYDKYKKEALIDLENEFMKSALKSNQLYQEMIYELQEICSATNYLQIKVSADYGRITLLNNYTCIFEYEYTTQDLFGVFERDIKQIFMSHIERQISQHAKMNSYINIINSCKNKIWKAEEYDGNSIYLYLCDPTKNRKIIDYKNITLCHSGDIKREIYNGMKHLLEHAENYYGIRFMEVR